jgi:hemerythrin-like metal-binding protein
VVARAQAARVAAGRAIWHHRRTMIRWSPALATGHRQIDAQHEELFRRLGALAEALDAGGAGEVDRLFEFLASYAADHFAAEERLLEQAGLASAEAHRAAHAGFTREVERLRARLRSGAPARAVALLARGFLVTWLREHIAGVDVELADALQASRPGGARAPGGTPGAARPLPGEPPG